MAAFIPQISPKVVALYYRDEDALRELDKYKERKDVKEVAMKRIGRFLQITVEFKAPDYNAVELTPNPDLERVLKTPIGELPGLIKRS